MEMLISEDAQSYRVHRSTNDKDDPEDTNPDLCNNGKDSRNHKIFGFYKHAVVLLGLLCLLLLAVIIGLSIKTTEARYQLELTHNKQDKEKYQLQVLYNNSTDEKDQLQIRFNNLKTQYRILKNKTSQTEDQYDTLAKERDELQTLFTGHNKQAKHDQLQALYTNLTIEKDQLQTSLDNLNRKMSQLQTQYTVLKNKTSQTEFQYDTLAKERDELQKYVIKHESMMEIKKCAVDVTLDPETAQMKLILSADGKEVKHGNIRQNVPDSPKRFSPVNCVLGKQGFSFGKFYYEVRVEGKTDWTLGVARESITRKGAVSLTPGNGYWTIWLKNEAEYMAKDNTPVPLSLKQKPQRVGVFVDYEAGQVSFYDADSWHHMYSYTNVSFTETLYPFFSPNNNNGGKNASPLIISPVCV